MNKSKETLLKQRLLKKTSIIYPLLLSAKSFGLGLKAIREPLILNNDLLGNYDILWHYANTLNYLYLLIKQKLDEDHDISISWVVEEGKTKIALKFSIFFSLQVKPNYYIYYDIWYFPYMENKIGIIHSYKYYNDFTGEEQIISRSSTITNFPRSKEELFNRLWEVTKTYIKIAV